jgi:hypothetical protein
MVIAHTDGTQVDTSQLNDFNEELLERTKDYANFMSSRKIPFILRYHDKARWGYGGASNFNECAEDCNHILFSLDVYLRQYGLKIVQLEGEPTSSS